MLQGFPFENDTIHLQCEVPHIPCDQDKYCSKKNVVALVSFFMCDQKDANKQKLEGDKKREKRNQTWVHLLKVVIYKPNGNFIKRKDSDPESCIYCLS